MFQQISYHTLYIPTILIKLHRVKISLLSKLTSITVIIAKSKVYFIYSYVFGLYSFGLAELLCDTL